MDAKSILHLVVTFLGALFKFQRQLTLENLALRQQVSMLRQSVKRPRATVMDGRILIPYRHQEAPYNPTPTLLHNGLALMAWRPVRRVRRVMCCFLYLSASSMV
jgi:hypothetical protein